MSLHPSLIALSLLYPDAPSLSLANIARRDAEARFDADPTPENEALLDAAEDLYGDLLFEKENF